MTTPTPRRGRPRSIPDGTRIRGIRLTDAEYAAVQKYVKRLRKRTKPAPARRSL